MSVRTASILPLAAFAIAAATAAQGRNGLIAFSQPEFTLSGSGGTSLQQLRPNETAVLAWGTTAACTGLSAEKWAPRAVYSTMAGDDNADGLINNATLFGSVDALVATVAPNPIGWQNQRSVFWSVSAPMGNAVSASPFRPGDVARIVRDAGGMDGQVEHFMTREQFNTALGLPLTTPIDVDAIAFDPQFGVFFSLDGDVPAMTACGAAFVQDGAVLAIPPGALTYTPDLRIATVLPNSARVILSEAQIDVMVVNANVANRFGACLTAAVDLEALDFDWSGAMNTWWSCTAATPVWSPDLIFSVETGTGASLLSTAGGGQIWNGPCAPMGAACGFGPTLGVQAGVRPMVPGVGVASHVNAFLLEHAERFVMEPQNPVMNVFPAGAPAGASQVHVGSPFPINLVFLEIVSPIVPGSAPAFPFSMMHFPDVYIPSLLFYTVATAPFGFGSVPTPAIPPGFTGKVLFQSVAFSSMSIELSTPAVIDVQ
ncbi:MAG: hypothetical protein INH34_20355 [Phycisphaerales bacterium]|nr:hypothetical protein [Phycisphaerales bacterium]